MKVVGTNADGLRRLGNAWRQVTSRFSALVVCVAPFYKVLPDRHVLGPVPSLRNVPPVINNLTAAGVPWIPRLSEALACAVAVRWRGRWTDRAARWIIPAFLIDST